MADDNKGAFLDSLIRSNKQIRTDRAEAIGEDAEITFKREVEDIDLKIKRLKRDQENMLDMSPNDTHSLVLATDFNSKQFVEKDIQLGIQIRNEEIKFEIAKKRYEYLFGGNK